MSYDPTTFDAPLGQDDPGAPRAYIAVASGPAQPPVVDLPRGAEVAIGRSRSSALHVDDGSVSRTHATLRWDGGGTVLLTDYGSRNGTLVDGQRVRGTQPVASGSEIRVGAAHCVLVVGAREAHLEGVLSPVDEDGVLARDPVMLHVLAMAERAARSSSTVLLVGETGAGKEILARRIHQHSGRSPGAFVALNCGAIPEQVAESTLFGHVRGAFTGASEARDGVFHAASGGTLFLDEVGELSLATQARLLRVLETRLVKRVGAVDEEPVDVRLLAATHRDLAGDVTAGRFRQDLLYRIDVLRLTVPPLRDRIDDIAPLARRFLAEMLPSRPLRLAPDALAALTAHDWPGNVRELRNVMERVAATAPGELVRAADLGDLRSERSSRPEGALQRRVDDAERDVILEALALCRGNQTQAARRLGISRRALIYRLEKLGLKALPPSQRG